MNRLPCLSNPGDRRSPLQQVLATDEGRKGSGIRASGYAPKERGNTTRTVTLSDLCNDKHEANTYEMKPHVSRNEDYGGAAYESNAGAAPKLSVERNGTVGSDVSLRPSLRDEESSLRSLQNYPDLTCLPPPYFEHNNLGLSSPYSTTVPPLPSIEYDNPHSLPLAIDSARTSLTKSTTRASSYAPFKGQFRDAGSASLYRKSRTRFDRQPYLLPSADETIELIAQNRHLHIRRIYDAMTCGEHAQDNNGSIAMKRWVHGAYYDSDIVEAYAHKVFDCILAQAREGFRGWIHNDYVVDDRKGEDEDRDVDCAGRLDGVIRALEREKTICEDVMNSACQIRMFVNAPKAYANRKHQNRVGNSKRGRSTDFPGDTAARPSKSRRLNRTESVRREVPSVETSLRDAAQRNPTQETSSRFQKQQEDNRLHFMTSGLQADRNHQTCAPALQALRTNGTEVYSSSPRHQRMGSVASPLPRCQTTLRTTSMPSASQSPYYLPPPVPNNRFSVSATSGEPIRSNFNQVYVPASSCSAPYFLNHSTGNIEFEEAWKGPQNHGLPGMSANLFDQHPEAAHLPPTRAQNRPGAFTGIWTQVHDAQRLLPLSQNEDSTLKRKR